MRLVVRGKYVAIGVVLHFETVGVKPVVKQLTAKDVTTDAPHVAMALRPQHLLSLAERVKIGNFIGAVLVLFFNRADEYHRMVICWLAPQVESAECKIGRTVRQILDV